ncbi:MAG TPA: hypothetical protein VGE26_06180 [Sphingobacteriaceae bacterium]
MKRGLSFLILFFITATGFAQHTGEAKYRMQLNAFQDSLKELSLKMINGESEPERYNANYKFIKMLVSALKTPRSYNFEFDSLKTISILTSPDRRFKAFSWHVMNNDGSYRYYGAIQMNDAQGKLKMFPLVDFSAGLKNPADTVTTSDKWYGAQYYRIIPVIFNVRTPYYILLGWKGNTPRSTKKVIEVLHFKDDKAYFGMPVFDGDKETPNRKRVIFEYTRQTSMSLNFDDSKNTIVFDHLAPPDPKMKGKFDMYGPDMSYDGYKLANGRWKLVEDLEMKNPPTKDDDNFNDPRILRGSAGRGN